MPLTRIELRDVKSFMDQVRVQRFEPTFVDLGQFNWDEGFRFRPGMMNSIGSGFQAAGYNHFTQVLFWQSNGRADPGVETILDAGKIAFDSQARNPSIGYAVGPDQSVSAQTNPRYLMGQPMLETGTQKIYVQNALNARWGELNQQTGTLLSSDAFPNMPNFPWLESTISVPGTQGYWDHSDNGGGTNDIPDFGIVFEGITSSVGMDDVTIGGSSHAEGLALFQCDGANITGGGVRANTWTWIDLATGNAVGTMFIPGRANAAGNTNDETPINGQEFSWRYCQFVPDPDSEMARPKGELHVFSAADSIFDQTITDPAGTATRNYVTIYDFNPFARSSGIPRVHERRIFLGIIDVPRAPIIAGGRNATTTASAFTQGLQPIYHQPSRSWFTYSGGSDTTLALGTVQPEVGDLAFSRYRREFVPETLSQPTPGEAVESGKDVRFRSIVLTDLGERAGGVSVAGSLFRVGSVDERINTFTPGVLGTYTVLEGSIDDLSTLQVFQGGLGGTLLTLTTNYTVNAAAGQITGVGAHFIANTQYTVVYRSGGTTFVEHFGRIGANAYIVAAQEIDDDGRLEVRQGGPAGTLLTLTTDYTVVFATGAITGAGSHWIADTRYAVRYSHRAVRLSPGNGTLLGSTVTTDENGQAFFDVRFPDAAVGGIDEIEVTV